MIHDILSKSQYMRGHQCVKSLWLSRHRMGYEVVKGASN